METEHFIVVRFAAATQTTEVAEGRTVDPGSREVTKSNAGAATTHASGPIARGRVLFDKAIGHGRRGVRGVVEPREYPLGAQTPLVAIR